VGDVVERKVSVSYQEIDTLQAAICRILDLLDGEFKDGTYVSVSLNQVYPDSIVTGENDEDLTLGEPKWHLVVAGTVNASVVQQSPRQ
jgi:hypothetical protein